MHTMTKSSLMTYIFMIIKDLQSNTEYAFIPVIEWYGLFNVTLAANLGLFQLSHTCSTETFWLGCDASDPPEVYSITPVLTTSVRFFGVDCSVGEGYNGLREVELWPPP